jgi:hypothetical protein
MQRLEVSGAVRPIKGSLGVKGLSSSYAPSSTAKPLFDFTFSSTWRSETPLCEAGIVENHCLQIDFVLAVANYRWPQGNNGALKSYGKSRAYEEAYWQIQTESWSEATKKTTDSRLALPHEAK